MVIDSASDHVHMEGAALDHPAWAVDGQDDGFDADALERAMIRARDEAYSELADLDAA